MIERIGSGIIGLDKLIGGGFVKGSVNLIVGATGTGKTTFGLQYIWYGLKKGENGIFLSLEQEPDEIFSDVEYFGWNFKPYIAARKCIIEHLSTWELEELPSIIRDRINSIKAKRLVLDPLSLVYSGLEAARMRSEISEFFNQLKHSGVTSLLICEIPENSKALSTFGVEEFIADSVIILHYLEFGGGMVPRSLIIRKMRRTKHGTDVYPFEITKRGIVVSSKS